MAQSSGNSFPTFSIGVREQSFNELPHARIVADRYHTNHIEHIVESDMIQLLPKMIWYLDEPSDPIAACQFHAAELAARHVKVVLGGDGGDELFAGFDRYLGVNYIDYYNLIPEFIRMRIIGRLLDRIPESFEYKNWNQKLNWFNRLSTLQNISHRYAEATCFFRFSHKDKQALFSDDLWRRFGELNSADVIVSQFESSDADDAIDKMLYADFMTRLPEHSLMLTDRMTMAHGLEARSPFLDHELVEFMAAFPCYLKIRGSELKWVLRRIAKEYLPKKIVKRDKHGFMFPIAFWFREELYPFIKHYLLNSFFIAEGLFIKERVLRLIEDHRKKRTDNHVRLWMLLNLAIWHKIYIEQVNRETIEAEITNSP